MKKALFLFIAISFFTRPKSIAQNKAQELGGANPFIGTTNAEQPTKWGAEGGTYPGAVAPWGRIQLSPETKTGGLKGYDYRDSVIYFFSCTNHSSGYPNGSAGNMKVLPLSDPRLRKKYSAGRPFTHKQESARPGYYQVQFSDDQGRAEMTSSTRTGMFRFHFPNGVLPRIFLGDMGKLVPRSKKLLYSERQHLLIAFPNDMMGMEPVEGGIIVTFAPKPANNSILLKMSISSVDEAGSMRNLQTECPNWNFDEFLASNLKNWDSLLGKVKIEDPSTDNKTKFYTALYHSYLLPWVISDVDGRYKGSKGKIYHTKGNNQYGHFSPWDTYRSLHPLLTLIEPDVQQDMIFSMLDQYQQSGKLPKGPMTGYHSLPIILDSWRKGIRGFDAGLAWAAMKASLDSTAKDPDFAEYIRDGYVSANYSESVTKTVEFAYNDWIMAEMAKEMGDTAALEIYKPRAFSYRNLFHATSGFILPKKQGAFIEEPESNGYKEGDKWIYSYVIPHDARGLVNLMGGDSLFTAKLNTALSKEIILFDNEPVFHFPYLFNFSGAPALTQSWVREIMQQKFSVNPGGVPGNDDLGSLSSWFVFNAMGFYPVAVGTPVYETGSPLFKQLELALPNGKYLVIKAPRNSQDKVYVKSLSFNGKKQELPILIHDKLKEGGVLEFEMSESPAAYPVNYSGRSATADPMNVEIINTDISATTVAPHEPVWLKYTLRNKGADGNYPMSVYVNGQLKNGNTTPAPALTEIRDSLLVRLYSPGKHKVRLNNGEEFEVEVKLPDQQPSKSFTVSHLKFETFAELGKQFRLSYTVQNITGRTASLSIPVIVNGRRINDNKVKLEPGQNAEQQLSVDVKLPGLLELKVDDQTALVKVVESARDKQVLKIAMGNTKPGELVKDLSGLGNHGQYREENRIMADNSRQTIQYVQFQNAPSLDELEEEITVMAWVLPGKQNGMADIVTKGDFIVFQQTGRNLSFFAGGWGQGSCDVPLPKDWENKWHHIAGVCKGRLYTVYIDGIKAGSFEIDRAVNLSTSLRWVLGGNEEFPDQRYFNGKINGFKVFASALSAEDIKEEMLPIE